MRSRSAAIAPRIGSMRIHGIKEKGKGNMQAIFFVAIEEWLDKESAEKLLANANIIGVDSWELRLKETPGTF